MPWKWTRSTGRAARAASDGFAVRRRARRAPGSVVEPPPRGYGTSVPLACEPSCATTIERWPAATRARVEAA